MSTNIQAVPHSSLNATNTGGVPDDSGEREKSEVEILKHEDHHINRGLQKTGKPEITAN